MEDEAELLRADERVSLAPMKVRAITKESRRKTPVNRRSTTIMACMVCAFLSFLLGVTVGHSWRGTPTAPIGRAATGSSAGSTSVVVCPPVYPNESAVHESTPPPTMPWTVPPTMPPTALPATQPTAAPTMQPTPPPTMQPTVAPATQSTVPAAMRMTKPRRKTIVLLGDSVTMAASDLSLGGFALRMSNEYERSADVLNRGITVYNTKGFLSAAIPVLEDEMRTWLMPSVVVIWFGVNDATVIGGEYESQHVPLQNYKKNLIEMVQRVQKASPRTKVILMTPMTVDISRLPTNRNNEQSGIYAAACREVLNFVENVTMIDMYKYMMDTYPDPTKRGALQVDGLHLNSEGHRVVAEHLMKAIERLYPGFSGRELQVPDWNTLNDKYPANVKDGEK